MAYAGGLGKKIRRWGLLEKQHELVPRPQAEQGSQEFVRVYDDAPGMLPDVPQHDPYTHALNPAARFIAAAQSRNPTAPIFFDRIDTFLP